IRRLDDDLRGRDAAQAELPERLRGGLVARLRDGPLDRVAPEPLEAGARSAGKSVRHRTAPVIHSTREKRRRVLVGELGAGLQVDCDPVVRVLAGGGSTVATESDRLFARASELIPGGVNSPVRSWRAVGGNPVFIARGEGPFVVDVDGRRYLDFVA